MATLSRTLLASSLLLGAPVLAGCELDLSSVAEPAAFHGDAASQAGDAAVADAETPTDLRPVKHPSCEMPLGSALPPEPSVARDARGRPLFDYWRDFACDSPEVVAYPTCEEYTGLEAVACQACTGAGGLCMNHQQLVLDRLCAPLVTSDPPCTTCVPIEAKRRACCLGIDTLCDAYPFAGRSQIGQPCALHADCERGLVCTTAPSPSGGVEVDGADLRGYGLCGCPGGAYPHTDCSVVREP